MARQLSLELGGTNFNQDLTIRLSLVILHIAWILSKKHLDCDSI